MMMFAMFIELTIASCRDEISLLLLIGYTPASLEKFLLRRFLPPNILIVLIAIGVTATGQFCLSQWLDGQQIIISRWLSWYTISGAILIAFLILLLNRFSIKKHLKPSGFKNAIHKIDG